jgi:hypothetical protein
LEQPKAALEDESIDFKPPIFLSNREDSMQATETDIEYPQSTDQVDGQVDGIAGGIMDLLDDPNPNASGIVKAKPAEPEAVVADTTTDVKTTTEDETDEPDKYTIRWQGQDKEVTQAELLDLAQKGFDYTQKTQALAQERDNLAPMQGLATLLKSDPIKAAQIAAILSGQAPQAQPVKQTFDDPIEQLKHEMKNEALTELRREMQQNLAPMQRQQVLNQVKMQVQSDPDFQEIHAQIIEMVKAQPPSIQKTLYLQLDQDPSAYLETFQHLKDKRSQKPEPKEPPKPVKKESRAPILEAGGVEAPSGIESKAKTERISKLKVKALREGNPTAIADWLKASGAIDHLY